LRFDFLNASSVLGAITFTFEDDRFSCGEQRFVTLACWLASLFQSYTRRMSMKSASSRSEKQLGASRKSTSLKSKTDGARLKSGAINVKPTPEHPEGDVKHIVRGLVRKGLKPLPSTASISLRVLCAGGLQR